MVDTSVLEDLGLTNAQIEVYVALLELGESTSGPILQKSKLQNSVVYNALNQLIEKGLVSFVLKGKRKYFSASNPENLVRFIDDKKDRVKELIPQLLEKSHLAKERVDAQVFMGWKGIYAAFNSILDTLPAGSEYLGFPEGFNRGASEETRQFFREFQKRRAEMKYKVKFIIGKEVKGEIDNFGFYSKFGRPEFRFFPGVAPIGLIVFGDNVLNVSMGESPVAVITHSKEIAESYRNFFYNLWDFAKK